jgi:hypothetical protein
MCAWSLRAQGSVYFTCYIGPYALSHLWAYHPSSSMYENIKAYYTEQPTSLSTMVPVLTTVILIEVLEVFDK